MATYKVLQDIESEDKLFGPFTLKQFIFGAIAILLGFIMFRLAVMGTPVFVKLPAIAVILPFFIVLGFLAAPLGRDQPNDIWLFAQLRYFFKPRTRIWDQDGMSDLVTITAPKREIRNYSNNFTQTEVKSRLGALASTLDSRGWAIKNVNANMFSQPGYLTDDSSSDRLVTTGELPQQDMSNWEVLASDDILDPTSNTTAQHLDQLVQQTAMVAKASQAAIPTPTPQSPQDYWFMNQPQAPAAAVPANYTTFASQPVVLPGTVDAIPSAEATEEEKQLIKQLTRNHQDQTAHVADHMKVLQPLHDADGNIIPRPPVEPSAPIVPVVPAVEQAPPLQKPADDGEITISLH